MADRTFASLVPRVQASVPGCPNATIVQYIRDNPCSYDVSGADENMPFVIG
jgi:hypothetical protein